MAGGWTRDGAVQDQIDDTVKDAILRARALTPHGDSAEECDDCGEPIPKKRREALPGVRTCVACQTQRDKAVQRIEEEAEERIARAQGLAQRGEVAHGDSSVIHGGQAPINADSGSRRTMSPRCTTWPEGRSAAV